MPVSFDPKVHPTNVDPWMLQDGCVAEVSLLRSIHDSISIQLNAAGHLQVITI